MKINQPFRIDLPGGDYIEGWKSISSFIHPSGAAKFEPGVALVKRPRRWYWHVRAANHKIVFPGGHGFRRRYNCLRAAKREAYKRGMSLPIQVTITKW